MKKNQKPAPKKGELKANQPKQAVKSTTKKVKSVKPSFSFKSPKELWAGLKLYVAANVRYFLLMPFRQAFTKTPVNLREGNNYVYRLVFVVIFFVALVGMPLLSFDYSVTWDEKIQRDYGREIIEYYESGGKDTTLFDETRHLYNTMLYYGCSFDVLTSVVQDKILKTNDEFAVRHFINALFGVFAMLYTASIARYLGSWRTACLAFAFALLSPSLFGHSMNNPKDIPFAASYIFTIFFMLKFLNRLPKPKWSHIAGMIIGIGWTISTRAGGLILVAFLGLFMGMVWLFQIKKDGLAAAFRHIKSYAVYFLSTAIGGYFLGLIIWPFGQRAPLKNPLAALQSLSNVNYLYTYENFDGERIYMNDVPWYYTIKLISICAPVFILLGCILAFALARWVSKKYNYNFILLLAFIFVFPIAYVAYKKSMLYNGWRHFLFVYLSLVVIAAIGWEFVICYTSKKWLGWIAAIVLIISGGKVTAWMVANHPNQYIYFNELTGGTKGAMGDYEMDYYSNTVKQAVEWLIANEPVKHKKIKLVSNNELLTVSYYTDRLADSIQVVWTRDYERQKQDWDYAIFTSRTYSPSQIKGGFYPPVGTIHTIDVDGAPVCAIVKRPNKFMSEGYAFSTKSKFAAALPFFEQAIQSDPRDEEAYRMAALCLLNQNRVDEALPYINKTMELFPDGFMAYFLKGFCYLSQKDDINAELSFKESIRLRINNGDAHAELGNIYLDRGDFTKALESYTQALHYGHANPATYTNMGITYMNLNDYNTAINYFNYAINKNQRYFPAYENMAECFEKGGDMETATQIRMELQKIRGH